MAKSFVTAKRSILLVAVLSVIGSCAQTNTDANNETTTTDANNETTTTGANNETTIASNPTATGVSSTTMKGSTTIFTQSTRKSSVTDGRGGKSKNTTADERISVPTVKIPPLPDNVAIPPAAKLIISGITCGVIIGVFLLCYIATMMNLCLCKFLMHECPSGKFKDDDEKKAMKEEKKAMKEDKKAMKEDKKTTKEDKKATKEDKASKKKKKGDEEAPPADAAEPPPPAQAP